jgi:signal transduction histidine kinase
MILHFQKVLRTKEAKLNKVLDDMERFISSNGDDFDKNIDIGVQDAIHKDGIYILFYRHDTLQLWTDKNIQVSSLYSLSKLRKPIVFLGNAWYRTISRDLGNKDYLCGLILIKNQYAYQNKFLHNDFQRKFRLPSCVELFPTPVENGDVVFDKNGEFLFSLNFHKEKNCLGEGFHWAGYLYFIGIIFFLILLRVFVKRWKYKVDPNFLFFILAAFLIIGYYLLFHFRQPTSLFGMEVFSPYNFALSSFLSSLGQFFFGSSFIFLLSYIFYKDFSLQKFVNANNKKSCTLYYLTGMILGTFFFAAIDFLFKNLILNSSLCFEPYKILDISYLSLVGYFSVVLLFISFGLYLYKLISCVKTKLSFKPFFISLIATLPVLWLIHLFLVPQLNIYSIVFFIVFSLAVYKLTPGFPYISLVAFSLLFGIYSTFVIIDISEKKEKQEREVVAVNISTERDPVAELLLEEVGPKISEDEGLNHLMDLYEFSDEDLNEIFRYMDTRFFDGYWEKYDLAITICNQTSGLLVDDKTETSCFAFFEDMINRSDIAVGLSGFYFIDNQTGGTNYFGSFFFPNENDSLMNGLFITLDSKQIFHQLGYPELLIDNSVFKPTKLDEFSYAKYKNGILILQSGDYKYSISDKIFHKAREDEFYVEKSGGFNHLVYNQGKDVLVVVSQRDPDWVNLLISFSYLFVFLFIISNLIYIISNIHYFKIQRSPMLKHKIQLWMVAVVFFSLIFIGSGTIYFSINQYRTNQLRNLSEKIQSVYVELDHKLGGEQELNAGWSSDKYTSLDELLIKFSNVFFSDINLYDSLGNLMATSRPEVFDKGLSGFKMEYHAYRELVLIQQAEFVQEETIGEQKFLSAYVPFVNHENHLVAYLNLPYFTKQSSITREVSNLVVGIVNFSMVMLLISTLLAVIVSTQITNPLTLIQEKIGELKLGRKNEPIYYPGQDEIGRLVAEYNRMIDELAKSADALAKSERESAWREMARQIAHEIKNPLTPMKLNIQHLLRSWDDKAPDWGIHLKNVSQTLIEQIDHLSSIATAFSNFAEMPRSKPVEVNIIEIIKKVVSLFSNNEDFILDVNFNRNKKAIVLADENQVIRVFNNLLKNAIQSFADDIKGVIKIDLQKIRGRIFIRITDNGTGISEDLGDKLFEPNFTTKTSGTGLGLAITKKIITDMKGKIWYESVPAGGTTFIIELPEVS